MANHEKSKKHKENLAALKLILQEETIETQSVGNSDGSNSDDSTTQRDRLSDTTSDTVDRPGDTGNNKCINKDDSVSNTTRQSPNRTTNQTPEDNKSATSTDSEDDEDILLSLAKNKTKQTEKMSDYHEEQFEPVSMVMTNKHPALDER